METSLNETAILLPSGDFQGILPAYKNESKISDDVQRDVSLETIIAGDGISITHQISEEEEIYRISTETEQIAINYKKILGGGYSFISLANDQEYTELQDYNLSHKMDRLYPLFYASKSSEQNLGLLRYHSEYEGYTQEQDARSNPESREGALERKDAYTKRIEQLNTTLQASPAAQAWIKRKQDGADTEYVFELTQINGMMLRSTGQPLTRLRDYQTALLQKCMTFISRINQQRTTPSQTKLSATIGMGVGAGKTFFTYTLLQQIQYGIKQGTLTIAPPFCLAPNEAVARVTANAINRQGVKVGTSATAITGLDKIPQDDIIRLYQTISEQAAKQAEAINRYIQNELQKEIIDFCRLHNLHPLKMINVLAPEDLITYKDSLDPKRLLLLIEGQKKLMEISGMLGIETLKNFSEQLTAIYQGVEEEKSIEGSLFIQSSTSVPSSVISINYNQSIKCPRSHNLSDLKHIPEGRKKDFRTFCSNEDININAFTASRLEDFLMQKCYGNHRQVRDKLVRMAYFDDPQAAILLANSGGLGNTYTADEIKKQIAQFLPKAYAGLKTLLDHFKDTKGEGTLEEHYTLYLYLYLNELFSTIPDAISLKTKIDSSALDRTLRINGLKKSLLLLENLQNSVATKLASIPKVGANLSSKEQATLKRYDLSPEMNVVDAANQIAGIIALSLTGQTSGAKQQLLLTHLPVFTPEGLTCYLEELANRVTKPVFSLENICGIYAIKETKQKVTPKDIIKRLQEIMGTLMIADEVHKEEFRFLYEETDPLYQRINKITLHFLGKKFSEVLPHRIGMSGTLNDIAQKAFGQEELYALSTQKMIQQQLIKKITVEAKKPTYDKMGIAAFAQEIVIDYFSRNKDLLIENMLEDQKRVHIDLFTVSKGLLFSKNPNKTPVRSFIAVEKRS